MLRYNGLLNEIYKEKEIINKWGFNSFKNIQDEKEFANYKNEIHRKLRLYITIVQILYSIVVSFYSIFTEFVLFAIVAEVLVILLNTILIIIIHKTNIYSKINFVLCYVKFFCKCGKLLCYDYLSNY